MSFTFSSLHTRAINLRYCVVIPLLASFCVTLMVLDLTSDCHGLDFGVLQGSVLGTLLYTLYTSPLADIARKHNINFHFYAANSQLYVIFKTLSLIELLEKEAALLACVGEMDLWMVCNKLKHKCDKSSSSGAYCLFFPVST